ncbi:NlpC/P60 family protein [Nocardioides sp.]|uniref:C40 family peptidase n=1 Tax=Nocardioides sp. TaxID=35761 RepID=UPI003510FE60
MLNGRNRITASLAALAVAGSIAVGVSSVGSPAQAEPDVATVRDRVEKLFHQAEQASERYNDARLELADLDQELSSLQADQDRQARRLAGVRSEVADAIVGRYSGGELGAAGGLLSSDSNDFLDQVTTLDTVDGLQESLLADYGDELKAYEIRRDQTEERRDRVADVKSDLAAEKKSADDKLAEAKGLLERLEAKEREAILSRGSERVPLSSIPASGRAKAAIAYAMAQVGDAYVYGAAGPNAFDCSGLTMMAWGQAGVGLPHSSRAQFAGGAKVAKSDLQPGDLVFYYSPISHVGMYIGNGLIVHAANPGAGVKVSSVDEMPYAGAVRPG